MWITLVIKKTKRKLLVRIWEIERSLGLTELGSGGFIEKASAVEFN